MEILPSVLYCSATDVAVIFCGVLLHQEATGKMRTVKLRTVTADLEVKCRPKFEDQTGLHEIWLNEN